MINKFILFICLITLIPLVACITNPEDIYISKKRCLLESKANVIKLEKEISRSANRAAVLLYFSNSFGFNKGVLTDQRNKEFHIKVFLVGKDGVIYETKNYGLVGGAYAAFFSYVDKNTDIEKIEILSTTQICCDAIIWHCYNPI